MAKLLVYDGKLVTNSGRLVSYGGSTPPVPGGFNNIKIFVDTDTPEWSLSGTYSMNGGPQTSMPAEFFYTRPTKAQADALATVLSNVISLEITLRGAAVNGYTICDSNFNSIEYVDADSDTPIDITDKLSDGCYVMCTANEN